MTVAKCAVLSTFLVNSTEGLLSRKAGVGTARFLAAFVLITACTQLPPSRMPAATAAGTTGSIVAVKNDSEKQLLEQVATLTPHVQVLVGSLKVLPSSLESVASGRQCRSLSVIAPTGNEASRLACTTGQAWFFVPNILAETVILKDRAPAGQRPNKASATRIASP